MHGEKTRCCYFIKVISDFLTNTQFRDKWIEMTLKSAGLSLALFHSHVYGAGLDDPEKYQNLQDDIIEAITKASTYKNELKIPLKKLTQSIEKERNKKHHQR